MRKGTLIGLFPLFKFVKFPVLQTAMKQHNINLEEAEHFQLGSNKEKQAPPPKK
jgi:hypothetical protein